MADETPAEKEQDWREVAKQLVAGLAEYLPQAQAAQWLAGVHVEAKGAHLANQYDLLETVGTKLGKALTTLEEPIIPLFAGFAASIVANLFGTDTDEAAFANRRNRGARTQASASIVDALMHQIAGDAAGAQEPGPAGAKRVASAAVQAAIEGWFNALVPELLESLVPLDVLHTDEWGKLAEEVIAALGLGRLVRRVLSPLVDAVAAEPMKWYVNTTYRPTRLPASTALRQFLRGRWEWADVARELAEAGYTDERIDALLSEQMKRPTVGDVRLLEKRGEWTHDQALQTLKDDGYDETGAELALRIEGIKRIEQQDDAIVTQLVTAYVDRRIARSELDGGLASINLPAQERAFAGELAEWRQKLNVRFLSAAQARDCVKAKILNVIDYRHALEREGYEPDAVLALELLLRHELDTQAEVEKIRAELVAQRDAEKKALEAERAKRAADVEAANALHRRGTITDLRAAVVRGLIPIARLEEVLVAMYDRDTVGIYMGLVEDERQAYLAQQQRADAARQRAQRGGLNEGQLAAGVLANVLTLDQYRDSLQRAGLAAADVAVLVATLAAKKKAMDDARTKRAQADAAAARKSIDLSRFEQLVRRGHRTIAEYDALLASLDFDEPSRAGMVELLQLKIADDADARALRAATGHAPGPRGLTLEQLRAAVIAGNASIADFQRYLDDAKYTADAQVVLLAELRDDVAAADAARQRRSRTSATSGGAALPLSRLLAAARLGILPPAEYQRRLEAAGYSADDVAIEMDLLLTEISQVQAARAKQAAVMTSGADKGLTLAEIAHAVKMGVTTIDAYRARAVELGLDAGDVAIVVGVLEQELLVLKDAKSRRTAIAADLVARGVALSDLEAQVIAGTMTVGAYQASLEELGVAADDADYLGALLVVQLEAADAGVA